ncbi:hypothetical protein FKP32DRAFT_1583634 [Trametes sanguinea]|nr:hypothetical protein FKP32DRAFT_1583634 [Trametes sanguinea]
MPSSYDAELILARVTEVIDAAEADGDLELEPVKPIDWAEGVEAYKKLTIEQMRVAFGLPTDHFPFFNKKTDSTGNEDPWTESGRKALASSSAADLKPFWHQWVGVLKIVDNMMDRKNLMLMDQVGVGKTLQAVGTLAMYEWLRVNKETRGQYPARFRKLCSKTLFVVPDKPPTTFDKPLRRATSIDPNLRDITIFSREVGVIIFDEAHYVRRPGPAQASAAELSRDAIFAMAMTATPIVTSPMVSISLSLGRLDMR